MKKLFFPIVLTTVFILLVSCNSSKNIEIPGKRNAEIKNIYLEYNNIADIYFSLGKYDKAVTYYEKALDYPETYWSIYYKLAKTYVFLNNWKKAEEMYKVILERDPDNSTVKSSLAYISAMKGNLKESEEIYSQLINDFPSEQSYLVNYISILILDKKNPEAITNLQLLKERFPDNSKITTFEKELNLNKD